MHCPILFVMILDTGNARRLQSSAVDSADCLWTSRGTTRLRVCSITHRTVRHHECSPEMPSLHPKTGSLKDPFHRPILMLSPVVLLRILHDLHSLISGLLTIPIVCFENTDVIVCCSVLFVFSWKESPKILLFQNLFFHKIIFYSWLLVFVNSEGQKCGQSQKSDGGNAASHGPRTFFHLISGFCLGIKVELESKAPSRFGQKAVGNSGGSVVVFGLEGVSASGRSDVSFRTFGLQNQKEELSSARQNHKRSGTPEFGLDLDCGRLGDLEPKGGSLDDALFPNVRTFEVTLTRFVEERFGRRRTD